MTKAPEQIFLIAVHYKNFEQTYAFLDQLKDTGIRIFIADNSASVQPLQFEHPQVQIFHFSDNPGYFGAVQRVYTQIQNQSFDKIIVSNTDLVISNSFITDLLSYQEVPHLGLLAPSIISSISRKDINPLYAQRPPESKMRLIRNVFQYYLSGAIWQCLGWLYARTKLKPCIPKQQTKIYAPHGSFMIFCKAYFAQGLDFNYPIFLYGEEIWVAENCRRKGLHIQYEPSLSVEHLEHGSLGVWPSRVVWQAHRDANEYILANFYPYSK